MTNVFLPRGPYQNKGSGDKKNGDPWGVGGQRGDIVKK